VPTEQPATTTAPNIAATAPTVIDTPIPTSISTLTPQPSVLPPVTPSILPSALPGTAEPLPTAMPLTGVPVPSTVPDGTPTADRTEKATGATPANVAATTAVPEASPIGTLLTTPAIKTSPTRTP